MIITLPDYDPVTHYISTYARKIIEIAETHGIKPLILEGKNATKEKVTRAIKSTKPEFIAFNGHGNETAIGGHDDELLIALGENEELLEGRIIHSFVCSSGKVLGKECGAKAFIGYNNWFMFVSDDNFMSRPLQDKIAAPIIQSALEAPIQIAKKNTVKEAYERSQEAHQKILDNFTVSNSEYTAQELQAILPVLLWNKTYQVMHGDGSARLT